MIDFYVIMTSLTEIAFNPGSKQIGGTLYGKR